MKYISLVCHQNGNKKLEGKSTWIYFLTWNNLVESELELTGVGHKTESCPLAKELLKGEAIVSFKQFSKLEIKSIYECLTFLHYKIFVALTKNQAYSSMLCHSMFDNVDFF